MYTNTANLHAIESLVTAAAAKMSEATSHVRNDAHTIETEEQQNSSQAVRINFAVGALLPLETLAHELLAIVAAARALQK